MKNEDTPDYKCQSYQNMKDSWKLCEDVSGGTKTIRSLKTIYLPQESKETKDQYEKRLKRSTFFPAFKKTVSAMTGIVFRKNITMIDIDKNIEEHFKNIDQNGNSINNLGQEALSIAIKKGHSIVFVDMPLKPDEVQTMADEQEMGLRPYWSVYEPEQLLSWRTTEIQGKSVLSQVVFQETTIESDGAFLEKSVTRFRVVSLGFWQLWEQIEDKLVKIQEGELGIDRIPLAVCYGSKKGLLQSEPPLLDLAYLNIEHYQKRSDHANILHISCVPVRVFSGFDVKEINSMSIGAGISVVSQNPHASVVMSEISGQSHQANREEINDCERRMGELSLNMFAQSSVEKTAYESGLDKEENTNLISLIAKSLSSCLNQCLLFHYQFMGLSAAGSLQVNTDFNSMMIKSEYIAVLSNLQAKGQLSLSQFLSILQRGDIFGDDFDLETELQLIKNDQEQFLG